MCACARCRVCVLAYVCACMCAVCVHVCVHAWVCVKTSEFSPAQRSHSGGQKWHCDDLVIQKRFRKCK